MTRQADLFVAQERGHADALSHLGAATIEAVTTIARVVADRRATWTWCDIEAALPDSVRQTLALPTLRAANGALSRNLARTLGWQTVGFVPSPDPSARGRRVALYAKEAAA